MYSVETFRNIFTILYIKEHNDTSMTSKHSILRRKRDRMREAWERGNMASRSYKVGSTGAEMERFDDNIYGNT